MKLYAKQRSHRFLIVTDGDPRTRAGRAVVADTEAQTVQRVKDVPALLRSSAWQPLAEGDPTLDALVRLVPALRPYRGIEIRLPDGETAWVRWRQWSSGNADAEKRLSEALRLVSVPAYEPDGDYFLAAHAVALLGGAVLDAPRSVLSAADEAY